jgi:hypothetical protein
VAGIRHRERSEVRERRRRFLERAHGSCSVSLP